MALNVGEVEAVLVARDLMTPVLQKAQDALKSTGTAGVAAGGALDKFGADVLKSAAGMATGLLTAQGLTSALYALVGFVGSSLSAWAQQEAAISKLGVALASTGNAAPTVQLEMVKLGKSFADTTVYSGNLLLEMESLLVQVGNVMPDQMRGALTATTDLASGLGIDLRTATMLVGKAFAGETGSLKKYGIVLDESRVAAEGVSYVLDELNNKFGGQAQAAVGTLAGKTAMAGKAWDDFKESVGQAIAPVFELGISSMTDAVKVLGGALAQTYSDQYISQIIAMRTALGLTAVAQVKLGADAIKTGEQVKLEHVQFNIASEAFRKQAKDGANLSDVHIVLGKAIGALTPAEKAAAAATEFLSKATKPLPKEMHDAAVKILMAGGSADDVAQSFKKVGLGGDQFSISIANLAKSLEKGKSVTDAHRKAVEDLGRELQGNDDSVNVLHDAFGQLTSKQKENISTQDVLIAKMTEAASKGQALTQAEKDWYNAAVASQAELVRKQAFTIMTTASINEKIDAMRRENASEQQIATAIGMSVQAVQEYITYIDASRAAVDDSTDVTNRHKNAMHELYKELLAVDAKLGAVHDTFIGLTLEQLKSVDVQERLAPLLLQLSRNHQVLTNDERDWIASIVAGRSELLTQQVAMISSNTSLTNRFNLMRATGASEEEIAAAIGVTTDAVKAFGVIVDAEFVGPVRDAAFLSASWTDTIDGLSGAFAQMAQVGGDSFGGIAKGAGLVVSSLSAGTKALAGMQKAFDAIDLEGGDGFSVKNIATLSASILSMAAVLYQVGSALSSFATKNAELEAQARRTGKVYEDVAGVLSDELVTAILATVDALNVALPGFTQFPDEARYAFLFASAEALHLSEIIQELGGVSALSAEQIAVVYASIGDLFVLIEGGGETAVAAIDELSQTVALLAAGFKAAGGIWDAEFLKLINDIRAAGIEVEGLSALLQEQAQSAATGLTAFLTTGANAYDTLAAAQTELARLQAEYAAAVPEDQVRIQAAIDAVTASIAVQQQIIAATGITSQASADAFGAALAGVFASIVDNGATALEAVRQMSPAISALETQLQQTGLSGGAAFQVLQGFAKLATDEVAGPALDAVAGLGQALVGMNNLGLLNQSTFAGLTGQITQTYNQLIAQGYDGDAAMRLMQPTLQTIWQLQQEFGYQTDAATQALLDEATASGIVGAAHKPMAQQMLDLTNRIVLAVEKLAGITSVDATGAFQTMGAAATTAFSGASTAAVNAAGTITNKFKNLSFEIPVTYAYTTTGTPGGAPPGGAPPGGAGSGGGQAAGGSYFVTRPTWFLAGEGGPEAVDFSGRNGDTGGGGGSMNTDDLVDRIGSLERTLLTVLPKAVRDALRTTA